MNTKTVFALGIALAANCQAVANINVEFRPANQTVAVNDTVNLGLYIVSDDGTDQLMSSAEIVFTWEWQYLQLLGVDDTGGAQLMPFPPFPIYLPLNEADPPADGDGIYIALAFGGQPVAATPTGTLLTTFQFKALQVTTGTPVGIPGSSANPLGTTVVWDGTIPNFPVTGTLTGATVVIEGDGPECGDPGTGDCCGANGTPYCDDLDCCEAVCLIDASCCDLEWDALCAGLAEEEPLCDCAGCGDADAGDCCGANGTPFCNDEDCCDAVCLIDPTCCSQAWDQLCADLAQEEPLCDCPDCGDAGSGPCCEANGTPFCDDADCCDAVCLIDPTCCSQAWDAICAGLAQEEPLCGCEGCGDVGTGDCCEANGSPYCDDEACCELVCALDSYCCETEWDATCAEMAQAECAILCPMTGACCFPDGSCLDGLTEDDCEAMTGGDFQGIESECLGSDSKIIVWGVDERGGEDSQMFVLNLATADLELVGSEHENKDIEGMTFYGNQVGGVTGNTDDPHFLVDMNFVTGALTTIASVDLCDDDDLGMAPADDDDSDDSGMATGDGSEVTGMATDGNGVQWAFAEHCGFGTLDLAGNFTLVVPSYRHIEGLAAALDGETLWGITDDGEIYEVDVSSGSVVEIDDVGSEFDDDDIENLELFSSNELAFFTEDGDDLEFTVYNIHTGHMDTTELRDLDMEDVETFVFASVDACPSLMTQGCGTAQAGDCCSENSTAGCLDAGCCDIVCGMDPFCCDFRWDAICAAEADATCGELCACAVPEVVCHAQIAATFGGDDGVTNGFATQGTPGAEPGVQAAGCGNGCSIQISWEGFSATACDLTYNAVVQMNGQIIPVTNGQIIEVDCLGLNAAADDVVVGFGHAGGDDPTALLIVTVQDEDGNEATDVLDLCEICEAASGTDGDNPPGGSPRIGDSFGGGIAAPPGP
jgi:hypothetical protein